MVLISPVIQKLKDLGYYIILNTGKRGIEIYKHDSRIDEFIEHDETISIGEIQDHWEKLQKDTPHDLFINFSESIECNVALHPKGPLYIYPRTETIQAGKWKGKTIKDVGGRNYYDVTAEWAYQVRPEGTWMLSCDKRPSLQFTEEEEKEVSEYIKKDKFNILWALSGSGTNKVYPWTDYVMGETLKKYPDTHFITVGDNKCQILEDINNQFPKESITQLSGKLSIRQSMLLTKVVDLVISPDTGILHASGCYDTPKIGLLGHTTIENITKYFKNDYSIESESECAPCYRLIYDYSLQCPLSYITKAAMCMDKIKPERIFEQIKKVRNG